MERFSDRGSIPLASTTRLSLHPFRGGMMPHPIRGRLSLHPIHVLVSCGAKLPASRCRVCACCGEGAGAPPTCGISR